MRKFHAFWTWVQPAGSTLFICFISCSSAWCQNYKEVAAITDSIMATEGYDAAEPWYALKADLAKKEFGDTSDVHMKSLFDKYLNQINQRKFDSLPSAFLYFEALLLQRAKDPDFWRAGYCMLRKEHCYLIRNDQEALEWGTNCYEILKALKGENSLLTIKARLSVAFTLYDLQKTTSSKLILLECLSKLDSLGVKSMHELVSVFQDLGNISAYEGNYAAAKDYYLKALDEAKRSKREYEAFSTELDIIQLEINFKSPDMPSENELFELQHVSEKMYGKKSFYYAQNLIIIGEFNNALERGAQALELFTEANEIFKELTGETSYEFQYSLKVMADAAYKLKDYTKALQYSTQALEISYKIEFAEDERVELLKSVALNHFYAGHITTADSIAWVVKNQFDTLDMRHIYQITTVTFLVDYFTLRRQYDWAAVYLDRYKALLAANYPEGSSGFLPLYKMQYTLSTTLGKQEEATTILTTWMAEQERHVNNYLYGYSEKNRLDFLKPLNHSKDYLLSRRLLRTGPPVSADIIYNSIFKYKSLIFQSSASVARTVFSQGDSTLIRLFNNWRNARDQMAQCLSMETGRLQALGYDVNAMAQEVQKMETAITEKSLEVGKLLAFPQAGWAEIAKTLPPGTAALDVYQFDQRIQPNDPFEKIAYAIFILKSNAAVPELVFLENGNEINSFVYEAYCQDLRSGNPVSPSVYKALWSKIAPYLTDVQNIVLAPDGIFYKINLAVLRSPDGRFIGEKFHLTTVQYLTELLNSNKPVQSKRTACLFGNPRFNMLQPSITDEHKTAGTRGFSTVQFGSELPPQFDPLPATQKEVTDIATLLNVHRYQTQSWTDTAATEVHLKSIHRPSVLHIATHGYFLKSAKREKMLFDERETAENPMLRSMLFFAGSNDVLRGEELPIAVGDGIFTAYEASNLDLYGTELVVLSACNTGLGVIENGEGVFGLQRAFRLAGARYVIISLWEVEDQATQKFMTTFYKNWLNGDTSIPETFQKTQAEMRQIGMKERDWGVFVLLGN